MEMQSKTRVELRLKVKILFKMSNWEKDSGWSRKKNRLITLGHHTGVACNVSKVEIDPSSATLHVSLQMAVTLIATFARSVECNRFIV